MYHDLIKRSLHSTTVSCHCPPPKRKLPNLPLMPRTFHHSMTQHGLESQIPHVDAFSWSAWTTQSADRPRIWRGRNNFSEFCMGQFGVPTKMQVYVTSFQFFFGCVFFPSSSSSEPLKKVLNPPIFWGTEVVSLPSESEKPVNQQHITNPKSHFEPGKWRGCNTWTTWFTVLSGRGIHEDTQHDQPSPSIFRS